MMTAGPDAIPPVRRGTMTAPPDNGEHEKRAGWRVPWARGSQLRGPRGVARPTGGILWASVALAVILILVGSVPVLAREIILDVGDGITRGLGPLASANQAIAIAMADQEAGQRGYVITGDERFLEPYTQGRDRLPALWPRAAQQAAIAGGQAPALLAATRRAAEAWQAERGDPIIALVRDGQREAAQQAIESGRGTELFQAFRRASEALQRYTAAELTRRGQEQERLVRTLTGVLIGLGGLGVIALGLLLYVARAAARAQVQATRAAEERRFRAMVERSADAVVVMAANGSTTYQSPSASALLGYAPEGGQDHGAFGLVHPDDAAETRRLFAALLASPGQTMSGETRLRHRDGTWRHLEAIGSNLLADPAIGGVVINFRDVTERKQAQAAMLDSNRRLQAALQDVSAREGVISRQAEHLRLLNDFARLISGTLDLDSMLQLIVREVVATAQADWCTIAEYDPRSERLRLVAGTWGEGTSETSHTGRFHVGAPIPVEGTAMGQALRTRAPFVTRVADAASTAQVQQLAAGEHVDAIVAVPVLIDEQAWGALAVGLTSGRDATPERIGFLSQIAVHMAVAIKNAQLYADLQRTLADLQRTQAQVVQQERLRAIGQMASGIAHDFNNALAPVVGFSELLLLHPEECARPEQVQRYLQMIHTGATDAAQVVRRLREFYREREAAEQLLPVELPALVEQAIALTEPKWKDQAQADGRLITVVTDLHPVPPVLGDAAELREVLTNLLFNAVDALPYCGTITLRTRATGHEAVLEVQDTGTGMTEAVRQRCLEPFFSTKGERGTGLGLAMVHGIVRRHHGHLEIESAPGQGTTIRLRLPVEVPGASTPDAAATTRVARSLHVLVVDDDPLVREVTAAYLAGDRHTVETAADGHEALARLRGGRFDLVLTDGAMPGMSGRQLATIAKHLAPSLPVILATGFGDLMVAAGERPAGVDWIIGKPLTQAKLREALAAVVGEVAAVAE